MSNTVAWQGHMLIIGDVVTVIPPLAVTSGALPITGSIIDICADDTIVIETPEKTSYHLPVTRITLG